MPIVLISKIITHAIIAYFDIFQDFANTYSITHFIIAHFAGLLVSVVTFLIIANLSIFLFSSLIAFARLFVSCIFCVSRVFCIFCLFYVFGVSSVSYVLNLSYNPYVLCNLIIV